MDELSQVRWDFRLEEAGGATRHDQATFLRACADSLRAGLWMYWIALVDAE